jgi:hypothetical protein
MNRLICKGWFTGGDIEPGTFHVHDSRENLCPEVEDDNGQKTALDDQSEERSNGPCCDNVVCY